MTKIKLCGLTRMEDIFMVNEVKPEFIGFVFWPKSRRNVTKEEAQMLKSHLNHSIKAVGVFVDAEIDFVIELLKEGIIDLAQLHGNEDEEYISKLREKTDHGILKAFTIKTEEDVEAANASSADYVLLDSGKGSGITFNWNLLKKINRPYFLAGGLNLDNVSEAIETLHPYGVDVSSGIETDGKKDADKIKQFVSLVR